MILGFSPCLVGEEAMFKSKGRDPESGENFQPLPCVLSSVASEAAQHGKAQNDTLFTNGRACAWPGAALWVRSFRSAPPQAL